MRLEFYQKLVDAIKMQEFSRHFDEADYESFKDAFKDRLFRTGQKILWRGQKGLFFFIIGAGKVSVRITGEDGQEKTIAVLEAGSFVGEISVLYSRPRIADCYAEEDDTLLFFLDLRNFNEFFAVKPEVRQALEAIAKSRMQQTRTQKSEIGAEVDEDSSMEKEKQALLDAIDTAALIDDLPAIDFDMFTGKAMEPLPAVPEAETAAPAPEVPSLEIPAGEIPSLEALAAEAPAAEAPPAEIHTAEAPAFPEPEAPGPQEEQSDADLLGKALEQSGILHFVTPGDHDSLKALFSRQELKKGESRRYNANGAQHFIVLARGTLAVVPLKDSPLEITLKPGQYFGEIGLAWSLHHGGDLHSREDSVYFSAEKERLSSFLSAQDPLREFIEKRALVTIFKGPFRHLTCHPHFESLLKKYLKRFKIDFFQNAPS
ncbi:MAG: cyclic nucleotide-binding domain-containing protein [Candidatus Eremiobacteraeota bacterium]|nr:cyclic nucleotide-binding domain-containing protein [Candidatus Eremiobacteraeota bacterium]